MAFNIEKLKIDLFIENNKTDEAFSCAENLLVICEKKGGDSYVGADYDIALMYATLGRIHNIYGKTKDAIPYLSTAQKKFELIEGPRSLSMVYLLMGEIADCWKNEGCFKKAEEVFNEIIENEKYENIAGDQRIAITKYSRAMVYIDLKRPDEAIKAFTELDLYFKHLKEFDKLSKVLTGLGLAYKDKFISFGKDNDFENSEKYFMKALSYFGENDKANKANTLIEFSNLYNLCNRQGDVVKFSRLAIKIFKENNNLRDEGIARSNLANALIKLENYSEARIELNRALECKKPFGSTVYPWKTWSLLSNLEKIANNKIESTRAWKSAVSTFLNYRKKGGESFSGAGQLCQLALQEIQHRETEGVENLIEQCLQDPRWKEAKNFLYKLQTILAGDRDVLLAEDKDLQFDGAVELLLLLESLNKAGI